jgi:hypothetical protein
LPHVAVEGTTFAAEQIPGDGTPLAHREAVAEGDKEVVVAMAVDVSTSPLAWLVLVIGSTSEVVAIAESVVVGAARVEVVLSSAAHVH